MSEWQKHCEALGVAETASLSDIRLAFRGLSLRYHPDRNNGDPRCARRFQEIAESYHYLTKHHGVVTRLEAAPPPEPAAASARPGAREERYRVRPVVRPRRASVAAFLSSATGSSRFAYFALAAVALWVASSLFFRTVAKIDRAAR